ncbi:hypothetical protein Tco_0564137 [Tanacetum coccineum]
MVPRVVLMKSGLVSMNTARQNISKTAVLVNSARQVNTAHSKTIVNAARSMSYLSKTAHSTVKRPIHKNTVFKNRKAKKSVKLMMEKLFRMELELMLAKTINGEVQLHALVDSKKIIITESTVRRDLQLEDAEGVDCLPNSTIFEQLTLMGSKTIAWNKFSSTMASAIICLATNQKFNFSKYIFKGMIRNLDNVSGIFLMYPRFENVSKHSNGSLLTRGNTLRSDEDRLKLNELMELCTNLQTRVLDLEKTKTTQQNEIASLKRRVKKLEKKRSSRTHKLKRLYKVGLTARVESFRDEEDLDDANNEMFDVNVLNGEEVFVAGKNENVVEEVVDAAQVSTAATAITITTKEITLAQALEALKTSKPKVKGIVFQDPEFVKPIKKKDLIRLDEEVSLKLQAEFDKKERLAREKAEEEKEANNALIEEWDDIQAKIDADYQLAERLQA